MLQKFVILKGISGKPLKRVFVTAEKEEIVICDPERFSDIKSGDYGVASVSYDRVFNFEEDAYRQLLSQWEMSRETNSDAWQRLGHIELPNDSDEHSCPFWC